MDMTNIAYKYTFMHFKNGTKALAIIFPNNNHGDAHQDLMEFTDNYQNITHLTAGFFCANKNNPIKDIKFQPYGGSVSLSVQSDKEDALYLNLLPEIPEIQNNFLPTYGSNHFIHFFDLQGT